MLYWQGPSVIDPNTTVQLILTVGSQNAKTGDMIQTWILVADVDPLAASRAMLDAAVCGDCPERRSLGGKCYVSLHQAPLSTWKAHQRDPDNNRRAVERAIDNGRPLRIGSYGDPTAIPVEVWLRLVARWEAGGGTTRTGYTHQWRKDFAQPFRAILMASTQGADDTRAANGLGWRAFMMEDDTGEVATRRDLECLSESRGKSCADCGLCNGAKEGRKLVNIHIAPHGALAGRGIRPAGMVVVR